MPNEFNIKNGFVSQGNSIVNGSLTTTTISATTYLNLPTNVYVTGSTYNNNTFTFTNNTGGTFNVLFNTVTGLTVNGDLTVTGTTNLGSVSATTFSGDGSGLTNVMSTNASSKLFNYYNFI